jgi:molybdopterin biosynthesis enzyme MoaB
VRAAAVTVSTSIASGEGEDLSGPRLVEVCEAAGLEVSHETVSDDREEIAAVLKRLTDHEAPRTRRRRWRGS